MPLLAKGLPHDPGSNTALAGQHPASDRLTLSVPLPLAECVSLAVAVADSLAVAVPLLVTAAVSLAVVVPVRLPLRLGVLLELALLVGDGVELPEVVAHGTLLAAYLPTSTVIPRISPFPCLGGLKPVSDFCGFLRISMISVILDDCKNVTFIFKHLGIR